MLQQQFKLFLRSKQNSIRMEKNTNTISRKAKSYVVCLTANFVWVLPVVSQNLVDAVHASGSSRRGRKLTVHHPYSTQQKLSHVGK